MKYADELDFIVRNPERLKFVVNLAGALKGNTLILFNFVEKHGKVIRDFLQKKFPEKQVCFISGEVDAVDRNDYRTLMEENDNVIIIASFGTTSTGVSIKRLNNIISASPTKSVVRVLQSIGRGLRTAHDKTVFTWYDIADDLRWKSHENHTYKHFVERLKIYAEEQFEYKIVEVQLKGIGE
jgi:superfamily II DNA or RNA helicase